jgi:hypothetical protein
MAFKIPYMYDCITKLCRQQADVIQNDENSHIRNTVQGEEAETWWWSGVQPFK